MSVEELIADALFSGIIIMSQMAKLLVSLSENNLYNLGSQEIQCSDTTKTKNPTKKMVSGTPSRVFANGHAEIVSASDLMGLSEKIFHVGLGDTVF